MPHVQSKVLGVFAVYGNYFRVVWNCACQIRLDEHPAVIPDPDQNRKQQIILFEYSGPVVNSTIRKFKMGIIDQPAKSSEEKIVFPLCRTLVNRLVNILKFFIPNNFRCSPKWVNAVLSYKMCDTVDLVMHKAP